MENRGETSFASACSADVVENKPNIYVTGFEPFIPYKENPSQLAVQALDREGLERKLNANVHIGILPVDYERAKSILQEQCQTLKPKLAVHVGLDAPATTLKLETQSKNGPYQARDEEGNMPPGNVCIEGVPDTHTIQSQIDMGLVRDAVNDNQGLKLRCSLSNDPGNFICGFLYYSSLEENMKRAAFIHVPLIEVSPQKDTAASLEMAITEMYRQVQ